MITNNDIADALGALVALAFPCIGAYNLCKTKGFSSQ